MWDLWEQETCEGHILYFFFVKKCYNFILNKFGRRYKEFLKEISRRFFGGVQSAFRRVWTVDVQAWTESNEDDFYVRQRKVRP